MQKHKGSNATVCLDKLACFMLEQMHTLNKNSPFQLLKRTLNFLKPFCTLSKHFKTFPKSYSNVSWLLYCLIWNHNITATSISVDWSKHDIFYFFGKSRQQVCSKCRQLAAILTLKMTAQRISHGWLTRGLKQSGEITPASCEILRL